MYETYHDAPSHGHNTRRKRTVWKTFCGLTIPSGGLTIGNMLHNSYAITSNDRKKGLSLRDLHQTTIGSADFCPECQRRSTEYTALVILSDDTP